MEGDKMFKAMEEVDRQNRQQKYLIAQYEDKIAGNTNGCSSDYV